MTTTPTIKLLLTDVDGVLTDGSIVIDSEGRELKRFHVRDGMGIVAWQKLGLQVGIVTGRPSSITALRAAELNIDWVAQAGAMEKIAGYERICREAGVDDDEVAFIGDDLADLPLMRRVAYPIAVRDAVDEAREAAKYVTTQPGGRAAVREAIEHLIKQMGRWDEVLARYAITPAGDRA